MKLTQETPTWVRIRPHPAGANSQVVLGSLSQLVKRGKDGTTVVEKTTRKTAVADTWFSRVKYMEVSDRLRDLRMEMGSGRWDEPK